MNLSVFPSAKNKDLGLKNPICVALDVDSRERALKIADDLAEIVGAFKVGPRLCLRYGSGLIEEISKRAPVFVDNKHFDIPSTMTAAIQASFDAQASLVTVHALSGLEALTEVAKLEAKLNQIRPFKVLAVTVLTSWDQNSLPENLKTLPISEHVKTLGQLVKRSGLSSIVCSAHELEFFEKNEMYFVTPGIRFDLQEKKDQKRTMGPKEALAQGANLLVVGRPIIEAVNSKEAALDYVMATYE